MQGPFLFLAVLVFLTGCGAPSSQEQKAVVSTRDYVKEGIDYMNEANVAAAIRSFDEAIRRNPRDIRAYTILGQVYMHMKQYPRAVDTFNAALRVNPDDGDILYFLAMNYGLIGNRDLAISSAKKSFEAYTNQKNEEGLKRALALWMGMSQSADEQE